LSKYVRNETERELVEASNDVKIRDLTKDDAERLIEVVGKWGFYMGTTNRLSSEDIIALCKFLKDSYDFLTIKELLLILNLNIKGTIGNIDFFGTLSPRYMSQVINAYLEYKRDNLKEVLDRRYADEVTPAPKITAEENHRILCDIIREEYAKYKKSGVVDDLFSIVYNYVYAHGYIDTTDKELELKAKEYAETQRIKVSVKNANSLGDLLRSAYNKDADKATQRFMQNYMVINLFSSINDIDAFISGLEMEDID